MSLRNCNKNDIAQEGKYEENTKGTVGNSKNIPSGHMKTPQTRKSNGFPGYFRGSAFPRVGTQPHTVPPASVQKGFRCLSFLRTIRRKGESIVLSDESMQ